MRLINFEINLILTWSAYNVFYSSARKTILAITDTKFYVAIVIFL